MSIRRSACLLALACFLPHAGTASGETEKQFWPEFDGYYGLTDRSRLFLRASLMRAEDADAPEGTPRYEDGKLGLHADISLRPMFRPALAEEDWERKRFLWMRVGYLYVGNYKADGQSYHEDRGVLELSMRQPVAEGLALTARLKWDLRDIDGAYSNRYRARAGLEWAARLGDHPVAPYAHIETSYDTRFDDWNRQRYQAGIEVTLNPRWRIEPYLAYQHDTRSEPGDVTALGLILKYYR